MDMLTGEQIAATNLTDWRKLGQGLHARYLVGDFSSGARFIAAVSEAGDPLGHRPRVTLGDGYIDLKLISGNAIYRDNEGTEYVVEWGAFPCPGRILDELTALNPTPPSQ